MFVVIEGIDGAGKGRQREEVLYKLSKEKNFKIEGEEFPVHNSFYESVIHPALQEETKMNKASWVLSFLLDKTLQAERINNFLSDTKSLFIADGYFTTTIAYQSLLTNQVPLEKLLSYAKEFEIPTPDLAIYVDVDPKVAMERKEKEEGHDEGLDINERDLDKQYKLRDIFKKMVSENIYCKWEIVDGNGGIEEIRDEIINILAKNKLLPE